MEIINRWFKLKDDKSKTVFRNVFFSLFIKGVNIGVNFLTVPLVLTFLNTTQYGVWLTLTGILGWFTLFDMGFGNGLRNHLTVAIAKQDYADGKIYVSTTYAAMSVIFGTLTLVFGVLGPHIRWAPIFNAPPNMEADISFAVVLVICLLFVQFVVKLINTILLSFQRAAMADFTNSLVQVCILAGLYAIKLMHISSLAAISVVYAIVPILVFLGFSFYLFAKPYSALRPSFSAVRRSHVKSLLNIGLSFFILQLAALVLYASDNIIIAQLFGPADVTVYNVAFKYYSILNLVLTIALAPFWSMTTQAKVEGDWVWIKSAVKKLNLTLGLLTLFGILQLFIAKPLIGIWTNNKVTVSLDLSITMLIYFVVASWGLIYSHFLNGVGKVKLQLYGSIFSMIFNIPFAFFLVKVCHLGIIGVPISTIITILLFSVINLIQYNKIVNLRAHGIWNE